MSNTYRILLALSLSVLASYSIAHSGRTDTNGGHNCSQASKDKGLCTGYHYHNGITEGAGSTAPISAAGAASTMNTGHKTGAKARSHDNKEAHTH